MNIAKWRELLGKTPNTENNIQKDASFISKLSSYEPTGKGEIVTIEMPVVDETCQLGSDLH